MFVCFNSSFDPVRVRNNGQSEISPADHFYRMPLDFSLPISSSVSMPMVCRIQKPAAGSAGSPISSGLPRYSPVAGGDDHEVIRLLQQFRRVVADAGIPFSHTTCGSRDSLHIQRQRELFVDTLRGVNRVSPSSRVISPQVTVLFPL